MISTDTSRFLLSLLDQTSLSAGDPAFEEAAQMIVKARSELIEAIDSTPTPASPTKNTK